MRIDYGKAIRTVRASRGMTQKETATAAHACGNYLSLVESGNRIPSTDMIENIAKALRMPVWALIVIGSPDSDVNDVVRSVAMTLLTTAKP